MDGKELESVSEFEHLESVYMMSNIAKKWEVAGAFRFAYECLRLGCARVQEENLLAPVLTYGNDTLVRRKKERS